jgi:uncharacterized protein (TIGR02646 family)
MRTLRRPQYIVPTMADGGLGGRQRLRDRLEYERTATIPVTFHSYWARPDVKGLLLAMQGRICAYCAVGTNGLDVDHFRPKGAGIEGDEAQGGYWWLAYDCSNYFLGCTVCNRIRKRTGFPLLPGAIRCTYNTRNTITVEGRLLLDPAEDPVDECLTIDPEDVSGKLIPNPGLDEGQKSRVQESIDLFGLNLDPEVRSQRSKAYELAARAAFEQRWDDLQRSAMRHRPHSLAARIVLQRVAPDRLPSSEDEMRDLVDLLWRDLRTLMYEIRSLKARGKVPSGVDERQLSALGWALAVLRSDPPAGDTPAADEYFAELLSREGVGIRTEIVNLFRELR